MVVHKMCLSWLVWDDEVASCKIATTIFLCGLRKQIASENMVVHNSLSLIQNKQKIEEDDTYKES